MTTFNPKSHPNKLLIEHKKGILSLCDICDLILLAVSFHDVGKINDNFQKKINKEKFEGYSNHAYISAYYLINGFVNNKETLLKRFTFINEENFEIIILILANVVIGHHGYLRNIDEIFSNKTEWDNMINYIKSSQMTDQVNAFFNQNQDLLGCKLIFTDDYDKCNYYKSYGQIIDRNKWSDNALKYYFDTITTFAELVNGDRKDASYNKLSYRNLTKKKYAFSLENNLEWIFNNFKSDTPLNIARNKVRNLAINKLKSNLNTTNERVFTLTAPTGSGKTLMMLQLATEIHKKTNYEYDIIYTLPYLSIIDQTTKIINNDLRIETLNYTSASDTSPKLQSMMKEEYNTKDLMEYAFSENSFDHPFIITTFNQLFETFLNNSTSKLLKLKNFKKRIFLIDEFQAASPSQYFTLLNILNYFCKNYDSYAIISTATMPYFGINLDENKNRIVKELFKSNFYPKELLPKEVFDYDVFNRYKINFIGEVNENSLYELINKSDKSTLLILNTIKTSQIMYGLFYNKNNFDKLYVLNAHISPNDRFNIITNIKKDLKDNLKILVISTQVIEAGVDISFPVVYRDAAPPSSIVQANGRGNRNGEFGMINTYVFLFKNSNEKHYDCDMVYQNMMTKNFKEDIKNKIPSMTEKEFHKRCNKYFYGLALNAEHGKVNAEQNIVDDILNGNFLSIGKYRFIQGDPDAYTIYVGNDLNMWNKYVSLYEQTKSAEGYENREIISIEFKRIRGIILQNCINIRAKIFEMIDTEKNDVYGIHRLIDNTKYNSNFGLLSLI